MDLKNGRVYSNSVITQCNYTVTIDFRYPIGYSNSVLLIRPRMILCSDYSINTVHYRLECFN